MSTKMSNAEWQKALSTLETKLLRSPVTLAGQPMEDVDKVRYINCILMYANVLRDCADALKPLGLEGVGQQLCDTMIINTMTSIAAFDADLIQDQLKALLLVIRRVSPQGMSRRAIAKIERQNGLTDDVNVRSAIAPFLCLERAVMRHSAGSDMVKRAKLFAICNQTLQFTVRLTLTRLPGLIEKHMDEYVQLENEMSSWTYDPLLISKLRAIVEEWLEDLELKEPHNDSHGYGATRDVARSVGTYAKWQSVRKNSGIQHWVVAKLLLGNQHEAVEIANELAFAHALWYGDPPGLGICDRFVKYMCVPKGLTKKRGVSMEDTVNQYYQKIIFKRLDSHFKKHPSIGVYLDKQEYSRMVARLGSRSGVFGTFDLSSASDTVTWTLVRELFQGTKLWRVLENTRTQKVYIEELGLTLLMNKAYGMGSACCFPIMSLILSAVCELANRERGIQRLHVVYGDDIVCHRDVAERIAEILSQLHFKLNTDKSYMPGSCFTEACGGEYYLGFDTEPLRISRSWDYASFVVHSPKFKYLLQRRCKRWAPDKIRIAQRHGEAIKPYHDKEFTKLQMETIRELANAAYDRGYLNLRRYCIQITRRWFNVLFFSNDSRGFHSNCISNQDIETRFDPYWRERALVSKPVKTALLYRVKSLVTHTDRPEESDSLRLELWFETRDVALRQVARLADELMAAYGQSTFEQYLNVRNGDDPDLYYTLRFVRKYSENHYQRLMRELSQLTICPNAGSATARYKWQWLPCSD